MALVKIKFYFIQADEILRSKKLDKEYSTIAGNPDFCKYSIKLALGDDNEVIAKGLVSIQNWNLFNFM